MIRSAAFFLASLASLIVSGCRSGSDGIDWNSGKAPAPGEFNPRSVTRAPLRDSRSTLVRGAACQDVLRLIAMRPGDWMNVSLVRWENLTAASPTGVPTRLPNHDAIRTFIYRNVSITERVHGLRPGKWFAYSYVAGRHSENWPFVGHLGLITTNDTSEGCFVGWRNYYNLPWGFSSGFAEDRLRGDLVPRALKRLAREGARLSQSTPSPGGARK
jgi:hypothetical protein